MPQYDLNQMLQNVHPSLRGQIQQKAQPFFQYANALGSLPDMNMINRLFDVSAGNLGQRMATERGRAQNTAGAIAGSRGYANPGAAILGAGNTAASPFIQALGGLEERRANAQTQLPYQNLQALLPFLQMLQQQNQFEEQNEAGFFDYFGSIAPLLAAPMTGGTSLLGMLFSGKGGSGGGGYNNYGTSYSEFDRP